MAEAARKSSRARKVSKTMQHVGTEDKKQAAQARLDALERDNAAEESAFAMDSDDEEFVMEDSSDEEAMSRKRKGKGKGSQRRTRKRREQPTSFAVLLEEADLGAGPNYLTAAAGPPASFSGRKFCGVCGFTSPYTCPRCGSRYCSRKCMTIHQETRCLKFTM
uniref:Zinc finger HIT domain-containing protein 1 n=1 Tax=Tetraselmis sp. GSL018 TaxID=582737 RepID=A0A061R2I5_9CHLO